MPHQKEGAQNTLPEFQFTNSIKKGRKSCHITG
jgi:hypothetical protein